MRVYHVNPTRAGIYARVRLDAKTSGFESRAKGEGATFILATLVTVENNTYLDATVIFPHPIEGDGEIAQAVRAKLEQDKADRVRFANYRD